MAEDHPGHAQRMDTSNEDPKLQGTFGRRAICIFEGISKGDKV
jgi:hypothetical protein